MATEQHEWTDRPADHYTNRVGRKVMLSVPVMDFPADGRQFAGQDDATKDPEQDQRARAAAATRRNH